VEIARFFISVASMLHLALQECTGCGRNEFIHVQHVMKMKGLRWCRHLEV